MRDRLDRIMEYCKSDRVRPPGYNEKTKESSRRAGKRHRMLYPDKQYVRNRAKSELSIKPCEVCGITENIQRHHINYRREDALNVIFLCIEHHGEMHSYDSFFGSKDEKEVIEW